jgi:hypothetical protein
VKKNRKEFIGIEPRGLSVPQAAAYVGISPNAYRYLMRDRKVPQPIKIPGFERQIIDKKQLDAALNALSGVVGNELDLDQELAEFIHGKG